MASKSMGTIYNVTVRVIDRATNQIVSEHIGHNQATNTLLTGIAHYLQGDGILNQANAMLSQYIPKYISLGTMGLRNQDESSNGLPEGIGTIVDPEATEEQQFINYMEHLPGFGADGYDANDNNGRPYFGLGPMYSEGAAVGCELISDKFLRAPITYRTIVPQEYAELPETVDVVFSAMISTGALAQFRNGADHIFISEIGLWNTDKWSNTSQNGLLAGYRIIPASSENWDMTVESNRKKLKESIIRVGINQVVQVIWKIQLGSVEQFGGYVEAYRRLKASIKTSVPAEILTISAENSVMNDVHGKFSEVFYPIEEGTGTVYQPNKWTGSVGGYISLSSNDYCWCESLPKLIKAGKVYKFTTTIDNSLMQWFFLDENGTITTVSSEYWFPITIDATSWTEDRYIITSIRNNNWRGLNYNGAVTITIT